MNNCAHVALVHSHSERARGHHKVDITTSPDGACIDAEHSVPGLTGLMRGNQRLVHGPVVVKDPEIHPDRIAIDTGAYATGRLTAVRLIPDEPPGFLTT